MQTMRTTATRISSRPVMTNAMRAVMTMVALHTMISPRLLAISTPPVIQATAPLKTKYGQARDDQCVPHSHDAVLFTNKICCASPL